MIDEWKTMTIGEICQAIYDGPHATPHKTETGPIFLGISNLRDGRIDLSGVEHLSEKDFIKWTRRVTPQADDIVFSYETRLGEAALVPDGLKFCLGRRMALMRLDKNKVDPRFLLYAYLAPEFQQTIKSRTVFGSTVDRIPLIEFSSFPITIPPLPTQHAIASVLASLDDKIELNRRMNATLEALAAALFKHWFVDNPEAEGWEEGKLGDVISVNEKSVTRNYPYETIEYIDISSVSRGHLDSTTLYSLNDSPSRAKRLVSHGDTIWSTVRPNRRSYLYTSDVN
jgi:type I restriction enzyme S subunit